MYYEETLELVNCRERKKT